MTDPTISRRAIDASLPKGSAWKVKPDGNLDKYLDSVGDDLDLGRATIAKIENIRNPYKTEALNDLEIDFGVLPNSVIDEDTRRQYLSAIKGSSQLRTGSAAELQARLRAAGYDLYVYKNDPPLDPADILMGVPHSTCGNINSTCGNPAARCGYGSGGDSELIVNGDMVTEQTKEFSATCGNGVSTCVDPDDAGSDEYLSTCGAFNGMARSKYYYPVPTNPARWKYIFWIAAGRTGHHRFEDWNMEHAGVAHWTENDNARATKTFTHKASGIRGLLIQQWGSLVNDGPYVEQTLDTPAEGTLTVNVTAWDFGTYPPVLMVADKDGVWDTAGRITGYTTGLDEGYVLSYAATNGVSAVRLYAWGAVFGADGQVVFDELEIVGTTFTRATILEELRLNLRKLILKLKPMDTWAALLVDYYSDEPVVPGDFNEDDMTYRTQAITEAGTVWIYESETAVHIKLVGTTGTETEAMIRFDDAQNFTEGRLYRLTNLTPGANITVANYDLSYSKTLPPYSKMDIHLIDNATGAGTWRFLTHVTGDVEEV